jgi:phosphohistidine swiveling domain-containing protein
MIKLADKYRIIFKIDNSFAGVSFVEGLGISGYKDLDFIAIYENKNFEAFLSETDIKKASEIGFGFCVNRDKTRKLHNEINELLKKVRDFFGELDEIDFSKLNETELKNQFVKYVAYTIKLYDYFSLTEFYYFYKVEDKIQEAISNKNDLATLLTSPKLTNILTEESFKRVELALNIKKDPTKKEIYLKKHLAEYDYIPYATGYPKWDEKSFNKEIEKLLKKSVQQLNTEKEGLLQDEKILANQIEILSRLRLAPEVLNLIDCVKEWQQIKWRLRVFINRTFVGLTSLDVKFLREMSKRYKYTLGELSNIYYQETLDLLDGKKIDKKEIRKRMGLYTGYNQNGKITFIYGLEVKKFAEKVREKTVDYYQKFSEFKGRTASPGIVIGKARVFGGENYSFKTQLNRMKKGEILVAESTSPEYMPAILKAAAIVADEGGITSHAAIISRELKIPCVVGIHYGIRNIKTGDTVEVDADKGTVKII